jgi:hypothetical protein
MVGMMVMRMRMRVRMKMKMMWHDLVAFTLE